MTNTANCASPNVDPQDWFLRSDGKQYSDEDLLTADERRLVSLSVLPFAGESADDHEARCRLACNAARNGKKREALIRRRKAKEACFACPLRDDCLDQALEQNQVHGTWGGYFEEELVEIRKEQARRRRRKGHKVTI